MAQEFAKSFYTSKQWQKCRESFIAKRRAIDGGMCQECGENLGYIVHHKIALTPYNISDPDISLNHSRLKYVCKHCHDAEHGMVRKEVEGEIHYAFDADGNPVEIKR